MSTSMELTFLGKKYLPNNQPLEKPLVQLRYMGQAYQTRLAVPVRTLVVLTYRGVRYNVGCSCFGRCHCLAMNQMF